MQVFSQNLKLSFDLNVRTYKTFMMYFLTQVIVTLNVISRIIHRP